MSKLLNFAPFLFLAALMAFGIQHFIYAGYAAGLGPPWITGRPLWLCFMGAVLLVASVSIAINQRAHLMSVLVGLGLFVYALFFYLPRLVARIHDPGPWTSGFEILAISGAALALAGTVPADAPGLFSAGTDAFKTAGRLLFAALLVVVETQHFLYAAFVATLVPSWIPARLFWADFVGAAFFAAAVSRGGRAL